MHRRHTDREYAAELDQLRERALLMGAKVEEMLAGALRALEQRDSALAERSRAIDTQVDELEVEIDQRALRVLARWHPMASDLRFITTVLKLVTNLERAGDESITICRHVIALGNDEATRLNCRPLQRLASASPTMLQEALDAFVTADVVRARNVIGKDDSLDAYYAAAVPEILALMKRSPEQVTAGASFLAISKALERIADHATTIAELVLFMVDGLDVRSAATRTPLPSPRQ